MKKALGFLVLLAVLTVLTATALAEDIPVDAAHFPDDNFRAYVKKALDKNKDGILNEWKRNIVNEIAVSNSGIASLQEIEYFPALQTLSCTNNQLTSLDVSANPALQLLRCYKNQLTSLDVSANSVLTSLDCRYNQLTRLNVSANPALVLLQCYLNQLTSLGVSANPALQSLYCWSNQLTSLDVSANPALQTLNCRSNQKSITAVNGIFDLSKLPGFDVKKSNHWSGGTVSGMMLTVPTSGEVTYIYDCGNGKTATFTLNVTLTGEPAQETVPGDVGGDGVTDGRDLLRLAKFIAGQNVGIDEKAADLTGDGKVDGRDVLRLAKLLAGI